MDKVAVKILKAARRKLDKPKNWRPGKDYPEPIYSIRTAINASMPPGMQVIPDPIHYVRQIIARGLGQWGTMPPNGVLGWEDMPNRRHAEVLIVLDQSATLAENSGGITKVIPTPKDIR